MIETIIGIGIVATLSVVGYIGQRVLTSVDRIDLVVRGDGNGNLGLGEKIRDVHQEVKAIGRQFDEHLRESNSWQERIVQCEALHEGEEE